MDPFKSELLYASAEQGHVEEVLSLSRDPAVNVNHQSSIGETPLIAACQEGHPEIVRILLSTPGIDPNLPEDNGWTPFIVSCFADRAEIVGILMEDQRVDVNKPLHDGSTPLSLACQSGYPEVAALLLSDDRVDVNRANESGFTPFYSACCHGRLALVKTLLASGREIDISKAANGKKSVLEHVRSVRARIVKYSFESDEGFLKRAEKWETIGELICDYQADPRALSHRLKRELGLQEQPAGSLFALVVFLSDGYLELQPEANSSAQEKARRFFRIASSLPMDLQMVLCNRTFGLGVSIVRRKYSELGFRKFAADPPE